MAAWGSLSVSSIARRAPFLADTVGHFSSNTLLNMKHYFLLAGTIAAIGVFAMGCDTGPLSAGDSALGPVASSSHGTTVNVNADNMNGWEVWAGSSGTHAFVEDASAPWGAGSLQLAVATSSQKVYLFNDTDYAGVPLSAVEDFSFWTFSNTSPQTTVFQFRICRFDTEDPEACRFSTVSVEPYHFGTVIPDEWQEWSLAEAKVWGSGVVGPGSQSNPISWADFNSLYPNGAIVGLAVNAGSGWTGFEGRFDALSVTANGQTRHYDFGPAPANPANANECKNGGWQTFGFRNQGQCIQYVNTGRDSR
ncbi:hypothetical protein BH23BAC4_BH23BAC4_15730 [soil metagenome]